MVFCYKKVELSPVLLKPNLKFVINYSPRHLIINENQIVYLGNITPYCQPAVLS